LGITIHVEQTTPVIAGGKGGSMQHKVRLLLLVLVLCGLAWSQTASAALVSRKISGVMPAFGDVVVTGPAAPQFSRNSTYMVYVADQRSDATFELFRAPVFTSTLLAGGVAPTDLLTTMGDAGDADAFALDPEGAFVAFIGHWGSDAPRSLYAVQVDGSALLRLSEDLEDDRSVDGFWVAPVGAVVAYGADVETAGQMELYVAYNETKLFLPVVKR
jgi:hypothetical protein